LTVILERSEGSAFFWVSGIWDLLSVICKMFAVRCKSIPIESAVAPLPPFGRP